MATKKSDKPKMKTMKDVPELIDGGVYKIRLPYSLALRIRDKAERQGKSISLVIYEAVKRGFRD